MSDATPTAERTIEQVVAEVRQPRARLVVLEFELKRLRNPDGRTMADLKGIWAGQDTSEAEINAAKCRFRAELEESR